MPPVTHEHLLQPLDHVRDVLERMLAATPRDHWRHQPFPGANHVAWTLGHLAWTDDLVLGMVTGEPTGLPGGDAWAARFKWGTTPPPAGEDLPSPDELVATLAERRRALRQWFTEQPADALGSPLPAELAGWCPVVGALPAAMAAHEGMHVGQLQVVRRSLGLEPVFM